MHTIADTKSLLAEGVITQAAARLIEARARSTMVALAVNLLLCTGILCATGGLIFWLADAATVAVLGVVLAALGVAVLRYGGKLYTMFGNAAALVGAGLLLGGACVELMAQYRDSAGAVLAITGACVAAAVGWAHMQRPLINRFVTGTVFLMGGVLHLIGVGELAQQSDLTGWPVHALWLYGAGVIALAGWFVDVRVVSAFAIVPFAQALDTSTSYSHASYAFYSPEPALSILQMTLVIIAGLFIASRSNDRLARHARIHVMMAFVVANLCALVGSLWGDVVGDDIWGPGVSAWRSGMNYGAWQDATATFKATALVIHKDVFAVLWIVALAMTAGFAAHKNLRGLFNGSVTFAAIHGYTQVFETFDGKPLAFVIGGAVAIPLAWGMWRLNNWFLDRLAQSA